MPPLAPATASCRFCEAPLVHTFADLGMSPLCESYVAPENLRAPEAFYPLHAYVCGECLLVQLEEFVSGTEIFTGEYAYFSSYSTSWVAHARAFVESMVERFALGPGHRVVEVASNDGYLLQHFLPLGIPVLGIEPAENVAQAARERGVDTEVLYLTESSAQSVVARHGPADLVVANNVFAHVPQLNDFTKGLRTLLAPGGVLSIEVAHLMRLMESNQFDTIYHEHFQYYSLGSAERVLGAQGLRVFDVEELPTHGGSIRVLAEHASGGPNRPETDRLVALRHRERDAGFASLDGHLGFDERVQETKRALLTFLIEARRAGKRVAAYGAPGKGNTLLNFCGIGRDLIEFTVDRNPYKQGKFLPGSRIPIHAPEYLDEARPDVVVLLPWNLKDELVAQLRHVRDWGGELVVPIPRVERVA